MNIKQLKKIVSTIKFILFAKLGGDMRIFENSLAKMAKFSFSKTIFEKWQNSILSRYFSITSTSKFTTHYQCATGNPVPVDPVIFFRSGSGQILTGSTGFG